MSPRTSAPARTATEQLLLSTAADRTVKQMDLSTLKGRKVLLDATNFDGTDKAYAIGALAARLNQQGALLVEDKKEAEAIAAIRAGALSIDGGNFLIGIPTMALPTPFGITLQLPEIALFKKVAQIGIAKFALDAREAASGKHVLSAGPLSGSSYYSLWTILFVTFDTTDIPEK
jgi:hypothetical protein